MTGKWFHFTVDSTQFEWSLTLFMTVHYDFDPTLVPCKAPLDRLGTPCARRRANLAFQGMLIEH